MAIDPMSLEEQRLDQDHSDSHLSLWTVHEVAALLRLTPDTVRAMARRGDLPGVRLGKLRSIWRFDKELIKKWIVQNKTGSSDRRDKHETLD